MVCQTCLVSCRFFFEPWRFSAKITPPSSHQSRCVDMKPRARRRHEMRTLRLIVVGVVVGTVMLLGGTARVMAAGVLVTLMDEVTVPADCQPVESPPVSTGNALQVTLLGRAEGGGVQIQLIFTADAEQGGGPRLRSMGA